MHAAWKDAWTTPSTVLSSSHDLGPERRTAACGDNISLRHSVPRNRPFRRWSVSVSLEPFLLVGGPPKLARHLRVSEGAGLRISLAGNEEFRQGGLAGLEELLAIGIPRVKHHHLLVREVKLESDYGGRAFVHVEVENPPSGFGSGDISTIDVEWTVEAL